MGVGALQSGKRISQEEDDAEAEALESEYRDRFLESEENGYELCGDERTLFTRRNGSAVSSVPTEPPRVRVSSPPPMRTGLRAPGRVSPLPGSASLDDSCSSPSGPPAKRARAPLERESDAALRVLIEREQYLRDLTAATTFIPIISATLSSPVLAGPVIESTAGAAANESRDSDPTAEFLAAFVNSDPD